MPNQSFSVADLEIFIDSFLQAEKSFTTLQKANPGKAGMGVLDHLLKETPCRLSDKFVANYQKANHECKLKRVRSMIAVHGKKNPDQAVQLRRVLLSDADVTLMVCKYMDKVKKASSKSDRPLLLTVLYDIHNENVSQMSKAYKGRTAQVYNYELEGHQNVRLDNALFVSQVWPAIKRGLEHRKNYDVLVDFFPESVDGFYYISVPTARKRRKAARNSEICNTQALPEDIFPSIQWAPPPSLDWLPTELLVTICGFVSGSDMLGMHALSRSQPLQEALHVVWTSLHLENFRNLHLSSTNTSWWFRSLTTGEPETAPPESMTESFALCSSESTRKREFFGPKRFETYLNTLLHCRLFRGSLSPRLRERGSDPHNTFNLSFTMDTSIFLELTIDTSPALLGFSLLGFLDGQQRAFVFNPHASIVIKQGKEGVEHFLVYHELAMNPQRRSPPFIGKVGIFVHERKVGFLRLPSGASEWQSTGLCVSLEDEFNSPMVTPSVSCNKPCEFGVEITRISRSPPVPVAVNYAALENDSSAWDHIVELVPR
jgi:hypothetical protein